MNKPTFRRFKPSDLPRLGLRDFHHYDTPRPNDVIAFLQPPNEAWTMLDVEGGRPVMCGGLVYFTNWRARAWLLVGRDVTLRQWGAASRRIGARLTELQDPARGGQVLRVEAETVLGFLPGHRLLSHLGFQYETHMPGCGPNGEPYALYRRLRDRPHQVLNRLEAVRALAFRTMVDDLVLPAPKQEVAA